MMGGGWLLNTTPAAAQTKEEQQWSRTAKCMSCTVCIPYAAGYLWTTKFSRASHHSHDDVDHDKVAGFWPA
jgi:hypothetical protein